MSQQHKINKSPEEIEIGKLHNLLNIKNIIIKHKDGDYGVIPSNTFDLTNNKGLWVTDDTVTLNNEYNNGLHFHHDSSLLEKGIFLDYPLNNDFSLKFKLNYQIIVNFYLGTDHLINFRNEQIKSDFQLTTNVWHDIEFTRQDGVISIKADGNLIKTVKSNQNLFIIRIYNNNREVHIKEFYATIKTEPVNSYLTKNYETQLLEDRLTHLEAYINHLPHNNDLINLKNEINNHSNILDTYNSYFDTLFIDYQLKPTKLMRNIQELCNELLYFISNVCNKYDIEWWLDFGNLIGALRHENFVPWDDDVDITMMRKEYHKLNKVLPLEVEKNNLTDCIDIGYRYRKSGPTIVNGFLQVFVKDKPHNDNTIYCVIDVVPFDYLIEYDENNIGNLYNKTLKNFYKQLTNGTDRKQLYMGLNENDVINKYFSSLNLSYEPKKYIIPGVEGSFGYNGTNMSELIILNTDDFFPLTTVKFGNHIYPAPKNSDKYMTEVYGDYMHIPKSIRTHGRVNTFRKRPNANKMFEEFISRLKNANKNFDKISKI